MDTHVFTRPVPMHRGAVLANTLKAYRFIGRDPRTGKLNTILHTQQVPLSLRTLTVPQYPDYPLKGTLEHLTEGVDVFTVHKHIGPGQFQPTVAEVLAQIPAEYQGIATHIQVLQATEIRDWNGKGGSRWVGQLRLYRLEAPKPQKRPKRRPGRTVKTAAGLV